MSISAPSSRTELADRLATLRQVYATGRTRSIDWRLEQLRGINAMLEAHESDFAEALDADLGRSQFDSWFGDIASTKGEVDFALKHLARWMRPRRQRLPLTQLPGSARIQYEPLGVVLVIGAWNYPIYLSVGPMVAALAAGNAVVLKPSEIASATSAVLARLIPQYLDPGAVQVVEGDGVLTQDLLSLGFDHALFTGGTEIGKKIMAGAAATLTPVTLELGGKSPVIVDADADLDVVARRLSWVKSLNSGQTCISPDYVLAHHSIRAALVEKIIASSAEFTADRPYGMKIVNQRQFDRLVGYIASTKGTVEAGGGSDAGRLTIEPTVLVDPDPDEPAMTDEIFGPILPVLSVDSMDEAIAFVNGRPKPLALYVFAKSKSVANRLVDAIPAGGAVINHIAVHCLAPTLPFGGVGASGMGAYHGEWGFQTLSHRKSVLAKPLRPDFQIVYPPYSERAQKLMRRIF
jgi:aldehyde dehydrogenase (NAD+)